VQLYTGGDKRRTLVKFCFVDNCAEKMRIKVTFIAAFSPLVIAVRIPLPPSKVNATVAFSESWPWLSNPQ
jgi:hypothetical protein